MENPIPQRPIDVNNCCELFRSGRRNCIGDLGMHENTPPMVKHLISRINALEETVGEVFRRAGVARTSLSNWRRGQQPGLANFEAVLNAVGLELVIRDIRG